MANWNQIKLWVGSTLFVLVAITVIVGFLAFVVGLARAMIDWGL